MVPLLFGAKLEAHAPVAPLLERASIVGIWEGISHVGPRLFLLELRAAGEPSFASTVVGTNADLTMVFQIESVEVARGKVEISGKGVPPDEKYRLKVVGRGRSFEGRGDMRAAVTVTNVDEASPPHQSPPQVDFVLMEGKYIKYLNRMYDAGEKAVGEAKKRLTRR